MVTSTLLTSAHARERILSALVHSNVFNELSHFHKKSTETVYISTAIGISDKRKNSSSISKVLLCPFPPLAVAHPPTSSVSDLCWTLQVPVGLDGIAYSGSHEVGM